MSTLIAPEDLREAHRLFDVRMGPTAAEAYRTAHLEGAHFVDVEADLGGHAADPAHGGRHPLPNLAAWRQRLGQLGIAPDTDVVAYDDAGGALAAARFWWMLRAIGHARVWVLDGGMKAAVAAGVPLTSDVPTRIPTPPYPATDWSPRHVTVEALEPALAAGGCRLLDARSRERFAGHGETYDPPGGHIPGAVNAPYAEHLDASGRFKSRGALRALYAPILGDAAMEDVVASCGSGITACHTLLALEHAGFSGARLYVGSFSEWSRSARPVERA